MLKAWIVLVPPEDLRRRLFPQSRSGAWRPTVVFIDRDELRLPWYRSLLGNMKDLLNARKLPPLEVTSKAVEVGSIWGAYSGGQSRSVGAAFLIQVAAVAPVMLTFRTPSIQKIVSRSYLALTSPHPAPASSGCE